MAAENFELQPPATPTIDQCTFSKVRVVARVRPFLDVEVSAKSSRVPISSCISIVDQDRISQEEVTVQLKDPETSRNECFQLDSYFGQEDHVKQIFDKELNPLIPGLFHGCNITVFAYGATASGKTYTMQGTEEEPGLVFLAMSRILLICGETGCRAEASYYEVYLERCHDLLEPKPKEIVLLDCKGQIHLKGLSKFAVSSMTEFREKLALGIQRRKVANTDLNNFSSRSHGVLVITVSSPGYGDSGASVIGKLNLIDLAGNEDNRRTGNEGIRLQESAKINQSLFTLTNVIHALNKNLTRVPYRESKLTRILQDSLGGTSRALMVACLNPEAYQESVHTLRLAACTRQRSQTKSFMRLTTKYRGKVKFKSPRKALSPVRNTNELRATTFEQMTPKAPFPGNEEFKAFGTTLDKFHAQVSTLKSCLAQDFVDCLNTATREELRELKGIGPKIVESILDLRERSPLKSLADLTKIGLSLKQIKNLFRNAASGMFDIIEDLAAARM